MASTQDSLDPIVTLKNVLKSEKRPRSPKTATGVPGVIKRAVLLGTGSYNPIHRMHVEMFDAAADYLMKIGWDVLAGFISPSADHYVGRKLGEEAILFEARCEMVKLAIQEREKKNPHVLPIRVHTWEGRQPVFVDFPDVHDEISKQIASEFPQANITVLYLCGMDL